MSREDFVAACLAGRALLDDVDDWIESWHATDLNLTLDQYLGFNDDEGALFAERPEALRFIVAAHRAKRPVSEVLEGREAFALAARAGDRTAASDVLDWLRATGRV